MSLALRLPRRVLWHLCTQHWGVTDGWDASAGLNYVGQVNNASSHAHADAEADDTTASLLRRTACLQLSPPLSFAGAQGSSQCSVCIHTWPLRAWLPMAPCQAPLVVLPQLAVHMALFGDEGSLQCCRSPLVSRALSSPCSCLPGPEAVHMHGVQTGSAQRLLHAVMQTLEGGHG